MIADTGAATRPELTADMPFSNGAGPPQRAGYLALRGLSECSHSPSRISFSLCYAWIPALRQWDSLQEMAQAYLWADP